MNLAHKSCSVCGEPGATEVLFGVRLCVRCASEEVGEGAHAMMPALEVEILQRELAVLLEEIGIVDDRRLQAQKARQAVKDSFRGMN